MGGGGGGDGRIRSGTSPGQHPPDAGSGGGLMSGVQRGQCACPNGAIGESPGWNPGGHVREIVSVPSKGTRGSVWGGHRPPRWGGVLLGWGDPGFRSAPPRASAVRRVAAGGDSSGHPVARSGLQRENRGGVGRWGDSECDGEGVGYNFEFEFEFERGRSAA